MARFLADAGLAVVHGQGGWRGRSSDSSRPWQPTGVRAVLTDVLMSLRTNRRLLRGIERDLAHCDPRLNMLFWSFTVQARGAEMPGTEMIVTQSPRLFGWLRRHADRDPEGSDGQARPRTLP
jgi:hypothetical protein